MSEEIRIGLIDTYEKCEFCGKEIHYNGYRGEEAMEAWRDMQTHLTVCREKFKQLREEENKVPKTWREWEDKRTKERRENE